ncbi:MAG TPA: hypothetical protein VNA25_15585 [Phycisphaerae bacterium]|nr:hypothetical protein [Phycisphaerae bacterium]
MRARVGQACVVVAAAIAASLLAGCGGPPGSFKGAEAQLPQGEQSPEFLDRVSSQKHVSENDAMRGILMLLDGQDAAKGFQQRVEALKGRNIVNSRWSFDAARPVTRGRLAYMLCQALNIQGGVILTLTGPSQRYCLRELQYQGFLASGIMTTEIAGGEFVAVLARADAYKNTGEVPEILKTSGGP